MAGLQCEIRNRKRFYKKQYIKPNGVRTTIHFGSMNQKSAAELGRHVEHLIQCQKYGTKMDEQTVAWLYDASKKIVEKLAKFGLCDPRTCRREEMPTITKYVKQFIKLKTIDVKPRTEITYKNAQKHLEEFFGPSVLIGQVKPIDAKFYWEWLRKTKKLGENTAKKRYSTTRQFFNEAVRDKLIEFNPFNGRSVTMSRAEKSFVERATIDQILRYCPNNEWKLLFALARYAGPRIPSEIERLTWDDVDWENNTMLIRSPKTESNGRSARLIPIFREVKPYLGTLFHEIDSGKYVFPILRHHSNLSTTAKKIVEKAKQTPWSNFWNSLRATRETELMDEVGLRRACSWIGNSAKVAMDNYALIRKTDYLDVGKSGAESGAALAGSLSQGVATHSNSSGNNENRDTVDTLSSRGGTRTRTS